MNVNVNKDSGEKPFHYASCIQFRSGIVKDWSILTLNTFLIRILVIIPVMIQMVYTLLFFKYGTFVVYMLNCSFHLPNILKLSQNVFEATISHIMPLIISELNFTPACHSSKRRTA